MGVCVIAEAGVNHNGDVGLAKQMIEAAASAGHNIPSGGTAGQVSDL